MPATKTITPEELSQLGEDLERVVQGLSFRPALERCQVAVVAETKGNFAGGHGPDGSPWRPILRLGRRGDPSKARPLRDRGLLMASVTARGATGNISEITDTSLEWGTNYESAATHQHGATILPKNARALAIP